MPGTYSEGKFDIAGFCVGLVEKKKNLNQKNKKKRSCLWQFHLLVYTQMAFSLVRHVLNKKKKLIIKKIKKLKNGC